jgi:hypothetical protein
MGELKQNQILRQIKSSSCTSYSFFLQWVEWCNVLNMYKREFTFVYILSLRRFKVANRLASSLPTGGNSNRKAVKDASYWFIVKVSSYLGVLNSAGPPIVFLAIVEKYDKENHDYYTGSLLSFSRSFFFQFDTHTYPNCVSSIPC